jgi:hypothetical protein
MNKLFNRILDNISMVNLYIESLDVEFMKSKSLESHNQCVSLQKIHDDFYKLFLEECHNFCNQKECNFTLAMQRFSIIKKELPLLLNQIKPDHLQNINNILDSISQFIDDLSDDEFVQGCTLQDLNYIKQEVRNTEYEKA